MRISVAEAWLKGRSELSLKNQARKGARRAKEVGQQVEPFGGVMWKRVCLNYGCRCAYCLRNDEPLTIDHVLPLARGGIHSADNIVPACRSCNEKKGNRTPLEFVCGLEVAA